MSARRPTLNLGVADSYAGTGEHIYDLTDPVTGLGGLIAVRRTAEGGLDVELYRLDEGVTVRVAETRERPGQ